MIFRPGNTHVLIHPLTDGFDKRAYIHEEKKKKLEHTQEAQLATSPFFHCHICKIRQNLDRFITQITNLSFLPRRNRTETELPE